MATAFFGFLLTALHVIILSQGAMFPGPRASSEEKRVCTSKVCKQRAKLILSSVDESVDPCDDFYLYACANRVNASYTGSVRRRTRTIRQRIKEMFLKMPHFREARNATEKTARMYQDCMDRTLTAEQELAVVRKALEEEKLAGWPLLINEKKPFKSLEDILLSTGINQLLDVDARPIGSGRDAPVELMISQTDSDFKSLSYRNGSGKIQKKDQVHLSLLRTAAKMLRPDLSDADLDQWATATTSFMLRHEKILGSQSNTTSSGWRPTIKQVQSAIPKFPLLKLLNQDLKKLNKKYNEDDKVAIVDRETFIKSMNFILEQDPIEVFNYIGGRVALAYLERMSKKFREELISQLGMDTDEEKLQSRQCFTILWELTPAIMTRLYIKKFFAYETKQQARSLLNSIGATYYERLKLVPWMDSASKNKAMRKLWNMVPTVGYPDSIMNETSVEKLYQRVKEFGRNDSFPMMVNEFRQNKYLHRLSQVGKRRFETEEERHFEEVNGFYSMKTNTLDILAGILSDIFFQRDLPSYINLGAVGMIMAHEITHGYDIEGRLYDEHGKAGKWWGNYTELEFKYRAMCFVEEYARIFDPVANMSLNGIRTIDENIADNGGLRVAFETYLRTQYDTPQATLPGLEKFTPEQLFFISNAIVWCESQNATSIASTIKSDVHSPKKYRVNVPMQNMEEFAAVFECKRGSRMRLKDADRCVMW